MSSHDNSGLRQTTTEQNPSTLSGGGGPTSCMYMDTCIRIVYLVRIHALVVEALTLCASHSSHMWSSVALGINRTVVGAVTKPSSRTRTVEMLSHISPSRIAQSIERLGNCMYMHKEYYTLPSCKS